MTAPLQILESEESLDPATFQSPYADVSFYGNRSVASFLTSADEEDKNRKCHAVCC